MLQGLQRSSRNNQNLREIQPNDLPVKSDIQKLCHLDATVISLRRWRSSDIIPVIPEVKNED